jgi:MFS family permease
VPAHDALCQMRLATRSLYARTFASITKHRNYRLYFIGQMVSVSGTWMQDAALPWWVLERTASPIAVGVLLCSRYVPLAVLSLPAGVLADRYDNRRLFVATQMASMSVALLLVGLAFTNAAGLWAVYVLAAFGGAATAFDSPTRNALLVQLVGAEEISNAVALNATIMNTGRLAGPALAGLVIAAAGVGVCFALNAVSFLAVLVVIVMMRTSDLFPLAITTQSSRGLRAIREGLAYVWREAELKWILLGVGVVNLLGFNFRVLLPVMSSDTLHGGPTTFGFLYASFGFGACCGALVAAGVPFASARVSAGGLSAIAVAFGALAFVTTIWEAVMLLWFVGVGFTAWNAANQSLLQLQSPDHLRGRVLSIYVLMFGASIPLGALVVAWLVSVGGTPLAFIVGASSSLIMAATVASKATRPGSFEASDDRRVGVVLEER